MYLSGLSDHISNRDACGDTWMLLRQTEDSSEFFAYV
jgi:hypothetical protein